MRQLPFVRNQYTMKSICCSLLLLLAINHAAFGGQEETALQKAFSVAVKHDNFDDLLAAGEPLSNWYIANRQPIAAAAVFREMSSASYFTGNYRQCIQFAQSGLSLLQNRGDTLSFKLMSTMAEAYSGISRLDSAAYWFDRSEQLLADAPTLSQKLRPYVRALFNNMGALYLRQKDPHKALLYFEKALDVAHQLRERRGIGIAINNVANFYHQTGRLDKAEAYYLEALGYFEPASIDQSWVLLSLGNTKMQQQAYVQALDYLAKCRQLYQNVLKTKPDHRHRQLEQWQLLQAARCYFETGLKKEASAAYRQCLVLLDEVEVGASKERAECLLGLGRIDESDSRLQAALALYQKALMAVSVSFRSVAYARNPGVDEVISARTAMEILVQKAGCLEQLSGQTKQQTEQEETFNSYSAALDLAEKMRKEMGVAQSKLFFTENIQPVIEKALQFSYVSYERFREAPEQPGWRDRAILLQERSRGVVLSDMLHERHIKSQLLPDELLEEETQLHAKIAAQKKQVAASPAEDPAQKAILNQLLLEQQRLIRRMEKEHPAYVALKYKAYTPDMDLIRRAMDDQTAYVSYFLTTAYLYTTLIAPDQVVLKRQSLPATFRADLSLVLKGLRTDPELFAFQEQKAVRSLYRTLIHPISTELQNYQRLVIARHGQLNHLPFEILPVNGEPLLYRFAITYAHSADVLTAPEPDRRYVSNTIGFAPFNNHRPKISDLYTVLEKTEDEISHTSNTVFLDRDATKEQFLSTYRQADMIHLATHGVLNDSVPENSYIAFSPFEEDFELYAHEIANLSLRHTRLAILSFCDADNGVSHQGEGIMSLARAFRLAGCPGVLTTLWKTDDQTTTFIVKAFYDHLREGHPADIALQAAKKDFLSSSLGGASNHPFFWAHLTYIGDPSPLFPQPLLRPATIAGGVSAFLLVLLVLYGGYRRKSPH